MLRVKGIIFDCDGVLVDSEPISNRVLVEMANELGAHLDLPFAYTHFKGNSLKNCIDIISEIVQIESKSKFEKDFRERSFAAFKKEIEPVKHIEALINKLEVPYCVASSGPEHKIHLNLKLTGLLPYFENKIYSCYTIQKWKPQPDIFLWAAKDLGVNPSDCLVIEDSLIGIRAAIDGGFKVCGYDPENSNIEMKESANFVISDMLKLTDFVLF